MKEYKVIKIGREAEDTEYMLNEFAEQGWKLICSYAHNNEWLILEKEKIGGNGK